MSDLSTIYYELLRRRARESMRSFSQYVRPRLVFDAFHDFLCAELEQVVAGDTRRLILLAPPQEGKSTFVSEIFPAYWLARRPDEPVILSSYGADLATEKSYATRQIIEGSEFQALFPDIHTRDDSRAKNAWRIVGHEGGMRAAGVGGAITGHPAGCAIIDDPVKNYEEAASFTYRESTWRWYETTLYSRLWENAPIILIMTRWHADDLAGRLLKSANSSDWKVLRLPALAETQEDRDANNKRLGLPEGLPDPLGRQPGEALAPHRFSAEYLAKLRDGGEQYRWHSLYQGSPRPVEGGAIKRANLQFTDEVPFNATRIRYWDLASTPGGGARTAGVLIGKHGGHFYIEDVIYGQWDIDERNAVMVQTATLDAQRYVIREGQSPDTPIHELPNYNTVKIYIEQEPGSSGVETIHNFVTNVLAGFAVYGDKVTGSKDNRLEGLASQIAAKNVYVKRAIWNEIYIDELTAVPNGMFRDMADASSGAYNKLTASGLTLGIVGIASEQEDWNDPAKWEPSTEKEPPKEFEGGTPIDQDADPNFWLR